MQLHLPKPYTKLSPAKRSAAPCGIAQAAMDRSTDVWRLAKTGNVANLRLEQQQLPSLQREEVTVAVKAIGVNFADVFTCLGLYQAAPKQQVVPGLEFAGIITDLAPVSSNSHVGSQQAAVAEASPVSNGNKLDLKIGDHVLGACRFGSYTRCLNVPAQQLLKMPEGWSFAQGAAFLVQSLTAYYGLKSLGNVKAGSCVLVHSAAGGVGLNALAICLALGAVPIGTVSSPDKVQVILERFPSLNPGQVLVRDLAQYSTQLQTALQHVQKDGFDIVMDAISGDYFQPSYQALNKGGRHVIFGAADWTPTGDQPGWLKLAWQYLRRPRLDPTSMIGDNKNVMAFNLIWMFDKVTELAQLAGGLQELNLPPPLVGETFDFADAPSALRRLQTGRTVGKVVLEVKDVP